MFWLPRNHGYFFVLGMGALYTQTAICVSVVTKLVSVECVYTTQARFLGDEFSKCSVFDKIEALLQMLHIFLKKVTYFLGFEIFK